MNTTSSLQSRQYLRVVAPTLPSDLQLFLGFQRVASIVDGTTIDPQEAIHKTFDALHELHLGWGSNSNEWKDLQRVMAFYGYPSLLDDPDDYKASILEVSQFVCQSTRRLVETLCVIQSICLQRLANSMQQTLRQASREIQYWKDRSSSHVHRMPTPSSDVMSTNGTNSGGIIGISSNQNNKDMLERQVQIMTDELTKINKECEGWKQQYTLAERKYLEVSSMLLSVKQKSIEGQKVIQKQLEDELAFERENRKRLESEISYLMTRLSNAESTAFNQAVEIAHLQVKLQHVEKGNNSSMAGNGSHHLVGLSGSRPSSRNSGLMHSLKQTEAEIKTEIYKLGQAFPYDGSKGRHQRQHSGSQLSSRRTSFDLPTSYSPYTHVRQHFETTTQQERSQENNQDILNDLPRHTQDKVEELDENGSSTDLVASGLEHPRPLKRSQSQILTNRDTKTFDNNISSPVLEALRNTEIPAGNGILSDFNRTEDHEDMPLIHSLMQMRYTSTSDKTISNDYKNVNTYNTGNSNRDYPVQLITDRFPELKAHKDLMEKQEVQITKGGNHFGYHKVDEVSIESRDAISGHRPEKKTLRSSRSFNILRKIPSLKQLVSTNNDVKKKTATTNNYELENGKAKFPGFIPNYEDSSASQAYPSGQSKVHDSSMFVSQDDQSPSASGSSHNWWTKLSKKF